MYPFLNGTKNGDIDGTCKQTWTPRHLDPFLQMFDFYVIFQNLHVSLGIITSPTDTFSVWILNGYNNVVAMVTLALVTWFQVDTFRVGRTVMDAESTLIKI